MKPPSLNGLYLMDLSTFTMIINNILYGTNQQCYVLYIDEIYL